MAKIEYINCISFPFVQRNEFSFSAHHRIGSCLFYFVRLNCETFRFSFKFFVRYFGAARTDFNFNVAYSCCYFLLCFGCFIIGVVFSFPFFASSSALSHSSIWLSGSMYLMGIGANVSHFDTRYIMHMSLGAQYERYTYILKRRPNVHRIEILFLRVA